jgi:hypothetical protein
MGGGEDIASIGADVNRWSATMQKLNDLSRSLMPLEPEGTLIAVIEMSQSSWLVAGIVPGVERQPLKKLAIDESALLKLLHRWREEAEKAGHRIKRIAVAFEAGRDGFWLARWLRTRDIEVHVMHASSVAVPSLEQSLLNEGLGPLITCALRHDFLLSERMPRLQGGKTVVTGGRPLRVCCSSLRISFEDEVAARLLTSVVEYH